MQHIKNKFTAGIFYSEMEINQIIKASITFDDYVLIRREGISKNLVGFLEMPDEFFISLYILMTYEKHRKLNLRKPSKN